MAKRTQINASNANLYYVDYQAVSEWKEEPENNILLLHLPNFVKEQIHITSVRSSRIVRVTGERQLPSNKCSRFNQAFLIPENCKLDKIHAKWQNGTLTITIPKEIITQQVVKKEEAKTSQEASKAASEPKPSKDHQEAASPKATCEHPKYSKDQQAALTKAAATSIDGKQNEVEKDAASTKATSTSSIHGGNQPNGGKIDALNAQKFEKEVMKRKGDQQGERNLPKAASAATNSMKQTDHESSLSSKAKNVDQMIKKQRRETSGNVATESEKSENVTEKISDEFDGSAFPKASLDKGKEKSAVEEKQKEKKDAIAARAEKKKNNITSATMKAVKGLAMQQNEDKRFMINMGGFAVLVIVAVGAYVSYSSGSKFVG